MVIVTGGNRGIGYATVAALWKLKEYHTIIACRNLKAGEEAASALRATEGAGLIEVMSLDLCSFASIRSFSADFKAKNLPLYALVNNAGILRWRGWILTKDGFEEHLQANHLGHFLLTSELIDVLLRSPTSRVVAVGSHLADHGRIVWGNLNKPGGWAAYKQSKLANLLHIEELQRRYCDRGLSAMCVDPGEVDTDITRHFPLASLINVILRFIPERNSPEQGADSVVYCATCGAAEAAALRGQFVRDRKAVPLGSATGTAFSRFVLSTVMRGSHDPGSHGPEAGAALWELSTALVTGEAVLPDHPEPVSIWRGPYFLFIVFLVCLGPILAAFFGPTGSVWAVLRPFAHPHK